jgi:hypothetical protein
MTELLVRFHAPKKTPEQFPGGNAVENAQATKLNGQGIQTQYGCV